MTLGTFIIVSHLGQQFLENVLVFLFIKQIFTYLLFCKSLAATVLVSVYMNPSTLGTLYTEITQYLPYAHILVGWWWCISDFINCSEFLVNLFWSKFQSYINFWDWLNNIGSPVKSNLRSRCHRTILPNTYRKVLLWKNFSFQVR